MDELKVSDAHRKNELSLEEGGATIRVVMRNGQVLIYDKIKSVRAYAQKAMKDADVIEIWHENTCLYKKA
jgi:hypothetical protein